MAEFKDQTLTGVVALDGAIFRNVEFKDAVLTYDGGVPPTFDNCRFNQASFTFREHAANTLIFLRAMTPASTGMRSIVDGLMPELNG
jgi:hypothetical protein